MAQYWAIMGVTVGEVMLAIAWAVSGTCPPGYRKWT